MKHSITERCVEIDNIKYEHKLSLNKISDVEHAICLLSKNQDEVKLKLNSENESNIKWLRESIRSQNNISAQI